MTSCLTLLMTRMAWTGTMATSAANPGRVEIPSDQRTANRTQMASEPETRAPRKEQTNGTENGKRMPPARRAGAEA